MDKIPALPSGKIFGREPVVFYQLIQAAIVLAVSFGFQLSVNQTGAILTMTTILIMFATRAEVTPNATADARVQEALYKEPPKQDELTVALEPIDTADASVDDSKPQGTTRTPLIS